MEPNDNDLHRGWRSNHGLIPGAIVIGIGVLFLLQNFHIMYIWDWWRFWPVAVIAAGLVKLVDSTYGSGRVLGGIMVGVGAIFMGSTLGFYDVTIGELWPVALIGLGLMMLGNRVWGPHLAGPAPGRWDKGAWNKEAWNKGREADASGSYSSLNEVAIFGGGKRKVTSQDFKGGELTAIFGGFEIDLRNAGMAGDSAVLEVNAVFGGAEIRIPETWTAVVQGMGIFGGYSDESTAPNPATNPQIKRLFLKGAAVFGGVSVKN
jgi:Domain of unknown function (DUF5668)/Cell wall-active antibiotics response 4TMS YvqF